MSPTDIYNSLTQIRDGFAKPSRMTVALISTPGTKSALDNAFERTVVNTTKSGWSLENKPPTKTFGPTDESVIAYAKTVAESASQSPTNCLIVIDMNSRVTSVWVTRASKCFIATAAYGSPMAQEVLLLSQWRDDVLMPSKFGRRLVWLYYSVSPPLASAIESNEFAKTTLRRVLRQIVRIVNKPKKRTRAEQLGFPERDRNSQL